MTINAEPGMPLVSKANHLVSRVYESGWTSFLIPFALTGLATLMRLYRLGAWSFWIDEIFTLRAAPNIGYWPILRLPLNLVLIRVSTLLLGVNEFSARLAPAIIGIATIPILFWAINKNFGIRVAALSTLLLAIHPWHIYWSQNARFYSLLLLFYALGLLLLLHSLQTGRKLTLGIGLFLLLIAVREKFSAALSVIVIVVYILAIWILPFSRPAWLKARILLILTLPILLYGAYETFTYLTIGFSEVRAFFILFGDRAIDDPFRLLSFMSFNIGLALMAFAVIGGLYLIVQKRQDALFLFVAAVAPVLLVLAISPFVFAKDRYIFISLPFWIILASLVIDELVGRIQSNRLFIILLLAAPLFAEAVGADLLYYTVNHGNRRDWKGAFELVESQRDQDDIIVATWPEIGEFYLENEILRLSEMDAELILASGVPYWFLLDSESEWATNGLNAWVRNNAELVAIDYLRVPEDISLRVYYFDPASVEP